MAIEERGGNRRPGGQPWRFVGAIALALGAGCNTGTVNLAPAGHAGGGVTSTSTPTPSPKLTPTPHASASPAPTPTPAKTPTPAPSPSATAAPAGTKAVLVLAVPCDALSQSAMQRRRDAQHMRASVSSTTYSPQSFSFAERGGATAVGTIAPPASNCSASSTIPTYTASVTSAPGSQTFTISTYASNNGTGTPLSTAIVVATLPADVATSLRAVLGTPVAAVSVVAAPSNLALGSTASIEVIVNAIDTAGETIVGPGAYENAGGGNVTIGLTDSDTSGDTKLSAASVTRPGTPVTLSYDGGYSVSSAAITGSAGGVPSNSATVQFACAGAPSTSALYALGFDDASESSVSQVDRFATTAAGFDPPPAGTLAISEQGSDGVNAFTFAVDPNGLMYLLGYQPANATAFIATYCPGSEGTLPAYRLFAPAVIPDADSGTHLALDAARNTYTTSIPVQGIVSGPSPSPPALEEYPAGAGAPGVPGNQAQSVAPSRSISGANTKMVTPVGVAIDSTGAAYVGDQAQINVFGRTQSGDAAPERILAQTAGGLIGALDAAFDAAGNLYVLYDADNRTATPQMTPYGDMAVAEFAPGATTPSRVISGPATTLGTYFGQSQPTQLGPTTDVFAALAVAPDGTIFVASVGTGKSPSTGAESGTEIAVFGTSANGNVAPDRTIDVTALAKPQGLGVYPGQLAADAHDTVYIGDCANADTIANGIYAFNAAGKLTAHIPTSANGLHLVAGLALDAQGELVAQSISFASGSGATALFVFSTNATGGLSGPIKTIPNGAAVPGFAHNRIAIDAAGDVYELSGASLSATATEVLEFSLNGTSGTPAGSFTDPQTAFQTASSIAIDPNGHIVIPVIEANAAFLYAPGPSGSNVVPIATYSDYAASTLNVRGVAFAPDGKTLYATSCDTDSVSIYANGAAPATRSIVGDRTELACPFAIALDPAGTVYVTDMNGISVFAATASGNVPPLRQIRFLQNAQSVGFQAIDVAAGPGPLGAANAPAARRRAALPSRDTAGGAPARSAAPAALRGRAICVIEERVRRALLAKLVAPGHAIPAARYRSPLCRSTKR